MLAMTRCWRGWPCSFVMVVLPPASRSRGSSGAAVGSAPAPGIAGGLTPVATDRGTEPRAVSVGVGIPRQPGSTSR